MAHQQAKNDDSQQVVKSNEKIDEKNGITTTITPHIAPYTTPFTTHKQKPFTNNINNMYHSNLIHNNKKSFNIKSPTDSLLSPCSKKLQEKKAKNFKSGKPLFLSNIFSKALKEEQEKMEKLKNLPRDETSTKNVEF
ncbi:hypothetical protein Glove_579g15 [Diversispora epigaea]|uniref:Uncharacterized protein n=1 Tax=Diversispora epigaea TaxID=1348612 RepID=A0A397G8Z3_9GLOM|nr:hypothetical protein Glove_579g15 [Diversispora epigaea]